MSDKQKHEWFESEGSEHLVAANGATYRVFGGVESGNYASKFANCELLTNTGWVVILQLYSGWYDAHKFSIPKGIERMKQHAEMLADRGASISTVK